MKSMKATTTLFFILIFEAIALANSSAHVEVENIEVGVILGSGDDAFKPTSEIEAATDKSLGRLYKIKNSRIKKALTFEPKDYSSKLV